tara:strand:- start:119 stop:505 length:387 start_codon:yes stop_codon:yes gene_type:complete
VNIKAPISLGELIDKISILIIKKENITNKEQKLIVEKELGNLKVILKQTEIEENKLNYYLNDIKKINNKLWKVEDKIRECEKNAIFDNNFIELARSVYKNNDERARIKLKINTEFNSDIIEIKSYKKY